MRIRKLDLLWVVAVAGLAGCDKTVGIDAKRPTFSKLLVPGACRVADSPQLGEVDISVMLLDGRTAILPDERLQFQVESVEETLKASDFQFVRPSDSQTTDPALAKRISTGEETGIGLQPASLSFAYPGGEERKDDGRLIILMMDYSGSLIGQRTIVDENGPRQEISFDWATDPGDGRIAFFKQLVTNLPEDDYLSLVWFGGDFPTIEEEYAQPTRNRDVILTGLEKVSRGENGGTPLADALDQVLRRVIEPFHEQLNPVVVVMTDGTEDQDTSSKSLEEVTAAYEAGFGQPVPVIVMELQPPAVVDPTGEEGLRGRHAELVDLACRTGGEHLFVERPEEFTSSQNLEPIVRNRTYGVWKLRTQTELGKSEFPSNEAYFLSTEMTVTLAKKARSTAMVNSGDDYDDTRLWFFKK